MDWEEDVVWQHDLTPEQAVEIAYQTMRPQMENAIGKAERGEAPTLGEGPMKPVDYENVDDVYIEVDRPDDDDDVPINWNPN